MKQCLLPVMSVVEMPTNALCKEMGIIPLLTFLSSFAMHYIPKISKVDLCSLINSPEKYLVYRENKYSHRSECFHAAFKRYIIIIRVI